MNYYDKNLATMKASQSRLYTEYFKKKDETQETNVIDEIQSMNARNGQCFITIRTQYGNFRLNSSYHPEEAAKKWAEQFKFRNLNTIVVMFGLGNGMLTRALMNRMAETDYLLLYEPSLMIFEHVLRNYDITDILDRENTKMIIEEINGSDLHFTMYSMINISNFKSQLQCIHPCYDRIFAESCLRYYKEIKNCFFTAKIDINTGIYLGQKFIENTIKNINYLSDSISMQSLRDILPKNLPAIVVAAGPSVQESIDDLKKAKGKAVIFAVDRILDYLLDSDVIPDFVVSVDPIKKLEHFTKRKDVTIPLICYLESNPKILHIHKGEKILCGNSNFIDDLYQRAGGEQSRLPTSGSVAIVAYSACVMLGFKQVILVGQDLAYRNGCSHVGGVTEENGVNENTYVEGMDGELVQSRHDWITFISQYQDMITFCPWVEVIDVKQQGARIKGTVSMPLSEAMKKYAIDGEEWKGGAFDHVTGCIQADMIVSFLRDQLPILRKIKLKAKKAILICDEILTLGKQEPSSIDIDENLNKLKEYNKEIQEPSIYTLLNSYISAVTAQQIAEIGLYSEDSEENMDKTFNSSKVVYQAVVEAVDYTRPQIKKAIKKLL